MYVCACFAVRPVPILRPRKMGKIAYPRYWRCCIILSQLQISQTTQVCVCVHVCVCVCTCVTCALLLLLLLLSSWLFLLFRSKRICFGKCFFSSDLLFTLKWWRLFWWSSPHTMPSGWSTSCPSVPRGGRYSFKKKECYCLGHNKSIFFLRNPLYNALFSTIVRKMDTLIMT